MNEIQSPALRFDDSLQSLVKTVTSVLGITAFEDARALRDVFGRLGYISHHRLEEGIAKELRDRLAANLKHYFADDPGIIQPDEFGFDRLWSAPTRWERVEVDSTVIYVNVVDRRIVGQDWLTSPKVEPQPVPRRMVFWSAKGGVGRTTALSVLALELAQAGHDVLVVDADLEAPGLGSLLLERTSRPRFGLIDFLADNGLAPWTDADLVDFVAPSLLTDRSSGQGLVDVIPAIGTTTLDSPENMLAKLSRALLEDPQASSDPVPVRSQLRSFVDRMSSRRLYSAVLVDARAGLAEIAAGAITGLGATVLVFGVNQTQTFEDYRFLFAHLARMPHALEPELDWRRRFRFVHAKADPEGADSESFKDRLYETLSDEFYEEEGEDQEAFNFSLDDPNAPHAPVSINFDFPYMRFDPVLRPGQLKRETYRAAFSEYLLKMKEFLQLPIQSVERT